MQHNSNGEVLIMFISIRKGIFEDDNVTEEINTSIKLFEEKMNKMEVPEINRTWKVSPLQITEPVTINNSIMIENQIKKYYIYKSKFDNENNCSYTMLQ